MSNTSSWLCPSIVVINPPAASAPVCKPTASIVNTTTLNNPLTSLRSAAVTIKATSQLQVYYVISIIIIIIIIIIIS